ncbi:MAG: energy transducer TonB [Bacteroidota bacterium]
MPIDKEPKPQNLKEIRQCVGYPAKAMKLKLQGKVFLRVLVNEQGRYEDHIVTRADHPLFKEAAENHIGKLLFSPPIHENKPTKYWVNVPFFFQKKHMQKPTRASLMQGSILHRLGLYMQAKRTDAWLQAGFQALDSGQINLAYQQFSFALKSHRAQFNSAARYRQIQALYGLGMVYSQKGQGARATQVFTEGLALVDEGKPEEELALQEIRLKLAGEKVFSLLQQGEISLAARLCHRLWEQDSVYWLSHLPRWVSRQPLLPEQTAGTQAMLRHEGFLVNNLLWKQASACLWLKGGYYRRAAEAFHELGKLASSGSEVCMMSHLHAALSLHGLGASEDALNRLEFANKQFPLSGLPYLFKAKILEDLEGRQAAREYKAQAEALGVRELYIHPWLRTSPTAGGFLPRP